MDLMHIDAIAWVLVGIGIGSLTSPFWQWMAAPRRYRIEYDSRSDSFRAKQ